MTKQTEKTKFIDYLYCNKDLIVSLLELLNMKVVNSYGVKKVIDVLKDMFIKYQNGQEDKKNIFNTFKSSFWQWLSRILILLILCFVIYLIYIINHFYNGVINGTIKLFP